MATPYLALAAYALAAPGFIWPAPAGHALCIVLPLSVTPATGFRPADFQGAMKQTRYRPLPLSATGSGAIWESMDEVAGARPWKPSNTRSRSWTTSLPCWSSGLRRHPSPPIQITLELMPEMEHECRVMLDKVGTAHDPLGELFSVLNID
jgi:hypothetical protein